MGEHHPVPRVVRRISAAFDKISSPFEPWLWALFVGLCRLPLFPQTEQDVDGANFARAVEHFDLSAWAPHPPGYPVFIAAGKAIHAVFLDDPARALAGVSLLAAMVTIAAVFSVFVRVFDCATARLTVCLFLASPLLTLFSVRPLSDGLGMALAWSTLALALQARATSSDWFAAAALVVAALLPGVRASAIPFILPSVFVALFGARRKGLVLLAAITALIAYIAPFLLLVDTQVLFGRTLAHAHGHFSDYGGSIGSNPDPVARFLGLVRAFWAHALGGVWENRPTHTLLTSASLFLLAPFLRFRLRELNGSARILLWSAGIYGLWIILGQNIIEQPRHVLPLVPVLLGFVARAALTAWNTNGLSWMNHLRRLVLVVGLLAAMYEANRLGFLQGRYPAHIVRIAQFVEKEPDASTLTVATCRFYRWIGWRAPHVRVVSVANIDEARMLVKSAPGRVLITSEVPGAEQLDVSRTILRVYADPFVRYVFEDVRLLELNP